MLHQLIAGLFKKRPSSSKKLRPQLEMVRPNLENLPEISIPEGYDLRTYLPGDEAAWCRIMEGNVGRNWTDEKWKEQIVQDARFDPGNLFFTTHEGEPVASGCAWRRQDDSEVGELHLIAALESHRGKGLGNLINAAILHRLKTLEFQSAHLLTDDFRLTAIKSYLKVGFVPEHTHGNHKKRWKDVLEQLGVTDLTPPASLP